MISKKKPSHEIKAPPEIDEPEALSFPDNDEAPPESAPAPKPHARVYRVGTMRFPVKEAPLRDSPRGKLAQKYKDILKKGKKASPMIGDADEHEPPRRPASSKPSRPGLPMGFPRFRQEEPEPSDDDDED
jgi:hypothetical protein